MKKIIYTLPRQQCQIFRNLIDLKLLHKLLIKACKLMKCMCTICARILCYVSNFQIELGCFHAHVLSKKHSK